MTLIYRTPCEMEHYSEYNKNECGQQDSFVPLQ